jgi:hypothetical protein
MLTPDVAEVGTTAGGIALAIVGYLLKVPVLEFLGIVCACIGLGLLLSRVLSRHE